MTLSHAIDRLVTCGNGELKEKLIQLLTLEEEEEEGKVIYFRMV